MIARKAVPLFAAALLSLPAHAGLKAFYTFEGNTSDVTGNGFNAALGGGGANPTFTASGYEGQAMSFDGGDFLTVTMNVNPSVMPQMTWGAWVNVADNSPIQQVLSHDNAGYDRSLGIDWRGVTSAFSAFTGSYVVSNGGPAPLGTWTFLAAVYDNSTNSMALWVDATKVTTATAFGSGWNSFRIGSNPSFGEHFNGRIDNVFVYDQALTDDQIGVIRGGAGAIMPVPEPETYALMLAGLGLLAAVARRRREA